MGLTLAYFQFRKGAPGLISSIFLPIIGEYGVKGPIGKFIDILAVFKIVTGIATSLGMGTMQIAGGLETLQMVSIVSAFPFAIVMLISIVSIKKALSAEFNNKKFVNNKETSKANANTKKVYLNNLTLDNNKFEEIS